MLVVQRKEQEVIAHFDDCLNTSYVSVQHYLPSWEFFFLPCLNTSYVSVQPVSNHRTRVYLPSLNTSYVSVQQ